MKLRCERCAVLLTEADSAFICSYECTFCPNCAGWFQKRCPNCSTELAERPRRLPVGAMQAVPC
ncbi:MAG TPA: DUF1272 domain-containing protein [Thermoanaerobaculia bacterium]